VAELEPFPEDWSRALAIAAHPDDFEYGMASAVAKWTSAGKSVAYLLVTKGEAGLALPPEDAGPLREAEERASAAVVGVTSVEFLDHRDGVVEYALPLRRDLARAVRRHQPDAVFTINHRDTWGGPSFNMADHRNVGLAVLDAVRDAANPWIFPELVAEGAAAWSGVTVVGIGSSPVSGHAVDVTGFLERGIASLEAHASYLAHVGTEADPWLREMAEATGARAGTTHAVAFELVRP
jgi:LmbE family N-acetylglucosaminyl deacetylase